MTFKMRNWFILTYSRTNKELATIPYEINYFITNYCASIIKTCNNEITVIDTAAFKVGINLTPHLFRCFML